MQRLNHQYWNVACGHAVMRVVDVLNDSGPARARFDPHNASIILRLDHTDAGRTGLLSTSVQYIVADSDIAYASCGLAADSNAASVSECIARNQDVLIKIVLLITNARAHAKPV